MCTLTFFLAVLFGAVVAVQNRDRIRAVIDKIRGS